IGVRVCIENVRQLASGQQNAFHVASCCGLWLQAKWALNDFDVANHSMGFMAFGAFVGATSVAVIQVVTGMPANLRSTHGAGLLGTPCRSYGAIKSLEGFWRRNKKSA